MKIHSSIKDISKFIGQRVLVLYLCVFAVFVYFFNFQTVIARAKLRSLNRMMPDFYQAIQTNPDKNKLIFKVEHLDEFRFYLSKITEYVPHDADAHSLLGYCHYLLGDDDQAIKAYEKSVQLNPVNLWSNFNLGIVYYKSGEYEKAAQVLEQAIATKPDIAMLIMHASKVYKPILPTVKYLGYELENGLKIGFDHCHLLLLYTYEKLENYPAMLEVALKRAGSPADDQHEYFYYAGKASYHLKDYGRAVFFLQESLQRQPSQADVIQYLGLTLKAMGREPRAANDLLRKADMLRQLRKAAIPKEEKIEVQLL